MDKTEKSMTGQYVKRFLLSVADEKRITRFIHAIDFFEYESYPMSVETRKEFRDNVDKYHNLIDPLYFFLANPEFKGSFMIHDISFIEEMIRIDAEQKMLSTEMVERLKTCARRVVERSNNVLNTFIDVNQRVWSQNTTEFLTRITNREKDLFEMRRRNVRPKIPFNYYTNRYTRNDTRNYQPFRRRYPSETRSKRSSQHHETRSRSETKRKLENLHEESEDEKPKKVRSTVTNKKPEKKEEDKVESQQIPGLAFGDARRSQTPLLDEKEPSEAKEEESSEESDESDEEDLKKLKLLKESKIELETKLKTLVTSEESEEDFLENSGFLNEKCDIVSKQRVDGTYVVYDEEKEIIESETDEDDECSTDEDKQVEMNSEHLVTKVTQREMKKSKWLDKE